MECQLVLDGDDMISCAVCKIVQCNDCKDWHKIDDCTEVSGNHICDDCFKPSHSLCSICNNEFSNEDGYVDNNSNIVCDNCYIDHYGSCYGCDGIFNLEVLRRNWRTAHGGYLCANCIPSNGVEDYHSSNETYNCVGKVKFGVELEYRSTDPTEFTYFEKGLDHCGDELRSGIMYGDGGLLAVRELAEYAENNGWRVNSDCGYHLHLDCRGLSVDQLKGVAYAYCKTRNIWAALVDPTRLRNTYCCPIYPGRRDLDRITTKSAFDDWSRSLCRYRFVNWRAYYKFSTVEIRGHEGTVSSDKVCNWIAAHTRFFDYVKDLSLEVIDKKFSNVVSRDFAKFVGIVGENVGKFYSNKVDTGRGDFVIKNRFAPMCPF